MQNNTAHTQNGGNAMRNIRFCLNFAGDFFECLVAISAAKNSFIADVRQKVKAGGVDIGLLLGYIWDYLGMVGYYVQNLGTSS